MNTKTLCLMLMLSVSSAVLAAPDSQGDMEGRHSNRLEHLSKNLDLTPEQKSQLAQVFKEEEAKLQAIHAETQNRLQEILSKEQLIKLQELKKQGHSKWKKKLADLKNRIAPE